MSAYAHLIPPKPDERPKFPNGYDFEDEYPTTAKGEALDTPGWRNCDNIYDTASSKDPKIITAVRNYDLDNRAFYRCIENGDDINATDRYGFTPLMLAIKNKQDGVIHKLLEMPECNINAQTRRGFTALMFACWKDSIDVVEKLIAKGADLTIKESGGRNAWGVAHDWHAEKILELLDKHGLNYEAHGGTEVAFPPHPKWRPSEDWFGDGTVYGDGSGKPPDKK